MQRAGLCRHRRRLLLGRLSAVGGRGLWVTREEERRLGMEGGRGGWRRLRARG